MPAYNEEAGVGAGIQVIHEAFAKSGRPDEIIVTTDADGTYPTRMMPGKVDRLAGCDMVVGSRRGGRPGAPSPREESAR